MIYALLMLAMFSTAQAETIAGGTGSSGGGNAIVCRAQNGAVLSARLYDLFEGEVFQGLTFPAASGSTSDEIMRAVANAPNEYLGHARIHGVNSIVPKIRFLPTGVKIKPTEDFGDVAIVVPYGCDVEGVGFYDASHKLFVASDVYNAMDGMNRAAFLLHEEMYQHAREFTSANNSKGVRYMVAALFATIPPEGFSAVNFSATIGYGFFGENRQEMCPVLNGPATVTFEPLNYYLYRPAISYHSNGQYVDFKIGEGYGGQSHEIPDFQCGFSSNENYNFGRIYANANPEAGGMVKVTFTFGGQVYERNQLLWVQFMRPQVLGTVP